MDKLHKDPGEISDGYHTFNELYDHRMILFVIISNTYSHIAWKSRLHDDGTMFDGGWFIAGLIMPDGRPITYHLENKYWDLMPNVMIMKNAPKWDGHTSQDVYERLLEWVKKYQKHHTFFLGKRR